MARRRAPSAGCRPTFQALTMMRRESGSSRSEPHDLARSGRRGRRRASASCATARRRPGRARRPRRPTRPRSSRRAPAASARSMSPRRNQQELVGDRLEVHLLRRHEREALGEVEAHLVAERADRACAGAVRLRRARRETWRTKSSYWVWTGRSLTSSTIVRSPGGAQVVSSGASDPFSTTTQPS